MHIVFCTEMVGLVSMLLLELNPDCVTFFHKPTLIARFMWPTRGPPGADRTQMGPMWVTWKLPSGKGFGKKSNTKFRRDGCLFCNYNQIDVDIYLAFRCWNKMASVLKTKYIKHFPEWKFVYDDLYFDICFWIPNAQVNNGLGNGADHAPNH